MTGWISSNYPPEFLNAFRRAAAPGEPGRCWLWQGKLAPEGYGRFSALGWTSAAHRTSYAAFIGNPPMGRVVRHRCDTPACWNPVCLLIGTHQDNMDDKAARNRSAIEDRHPQAKLTTALARQIVSTYNAGAYPLQIARQLGVTAGTVRSVINRETWRNATADLPVVRSSRLLRGVDHPQAKLTEALAREIALAYIDGASQRQLAAQYGVSRGAVSDLLRGRTWPAATRGLPIADVDSKARQDAALAAARQTKSRRVR